ncbi:MAG: hypothetical protein LBE09_04265 [Christensenellaceae bacterium]|jgi:hypothetical protein|nr:hypothetical protein [Christensenellaceae bacterium]
MNDRSCTFKFIILLAFTMMLVVFSAFMVSNGVSAYATEVSLIDVAYSYNQTEFDNYTNSDLLYQPNPQETGLGINDYKNQLYKNGSSASQSNEIVNVNVVADDPIVKIVPRQLFERRGEYLHIGREYGFFVSTSRFNTYANKSVVLVFDIIKYPLNNSGYPSQYVIEIKPIFEYAYHYLTDNDNYSSGDSLLKYNVASLSSVVVAAPFVNQYEGSTYYYYNETTTHFIKDISFGLSLYNEQELNIGDTGYVANADDGAFVTRANINFSGVGNQSLIGSTVLSTIKFGLGFMPHLGYGISIIEYGIELTKNASSDFRESSEYGNYYNSQYYNSKQEQLSHYSNLNKSSIIQLLSDDPKPLLFGRSEDGNYIRGTFTLGMTDNWYTRVVDTIQLSVVTESTNLLSGNSTITSRMTFDRSSTTNIRDKTDKVLELNTAKRAAVLFEGIDYFKFVPQQNGYYTFETSGNKSTKLALSGVPVDEQTVTNGQNATITAYLRAGQTYNLQASLKAADDYGVFDVNVRIETISAPATSKTITARPSSEGALMYELLSTKSAAFKISSTNSNMYFSILDSNLNVVTSTSTNELHHYWESSSKFYLLVYNKSQSSLSCTISIAEAESLTEDTQYSKSSTSEFRYYKFKALVEGDYTIATQGFSGALTYKLYEADATNTMSVTGSYVIFVYLLKNQEMYFGTKIASSHTIKVTKAENALKWVVGGAEQTGNNVSLKRGTSTTIRLKIGSYYHDTAIYMQANNYYRLTNNTFAIDNNCPTSDSNDLHPYVYLYAINNNTPFALHIFILHNLTISFGKYSDNASYGINWSTFSNISTDKVDIYYTAKTANGKSRKETVSGKNSSSSQSIQSVIETSLGYVGVIDAEIIIEKLGFKQGTHTTFIYNTECAGYASLTALQKKQSFTHVTLTVNSLFGIGSGTESDPFTINSIRHLRNIDEVKYYDDIDGMTFVGLNYFKLVNSITLSGNWTALANDVNGFAGTLDGNGYTISGLQISAPNVGYYGLFKMNYGKIKNLTLSSVNISAKSDDSNQVTLLGSITAYNLGTIENCTVSGGSLNMEGKNTSIGGIAALNASFIVNSKNYATIKSDDANKSAQYENQTGGIVGLNSGTMTNCINYGIVEGNNNTGGVAGFMEFGSINGCKNYGSVKFSCKEINARYNNAGGIVGETYYGSVTNCTNYATVYYTNDEATKNTSLQPKLGQIVGYVYNTSLSGNTLSGNVNKGTLYSFKYGGLFGIGRKTHDQALYATNNAYGYIA